ncbi:MAG: DNA primase, partial [Vicinamibacteria bacterium]|nr:DNA primase [Vicinamibacteria bacterium]
MGLPDSFVEDVRRAADIVRYISEYVPLKKLGASWKGLCPFHHEKTPSFNVRVDPPIFHCFGCGVGGDIFKFVMLRESASFPEAIEIVARHFGLQVPERRADGGAERKQREQMLAVLAAAARHFQQIFWSPAGQTAREYMDNRGFNRKTLESLGVGAARDSWSDLLEALRRQFSEQALLEAGLIIPRQSGKGHYDRFRGRVVFPISNEQGAVVAFGARCLDGSEPKYLNSPETPVYQKNRVLYGLHWAKESIRKDKYAVLMEGYLDVARAIQEGFRTAVATCGTALTSSHVQLLKRFTEKVMVNFDQDEAGQKAAYKSLEVLRDQGLDSYVVELETGHDPDSYIKQFGIGAYRDKLAGAPLHMEWLILRAVKRHDTRTPAGKTTYFRELLPELARMESPAQRDIWLDAVAHRGHIDPSAARAELTRALSTTSEIQSVARPAAISSASLWGAEKSLLVTLAKGAPGAEAALEDLEDDELASLSSADILRAAKRLQQRGSVVNATALAAEVGGEAVEGVLSRLALEERPQESPLECVHALKRKALKEKMAEIQARLARADG